MNVLDSDIDAPAVLETALEASEEWGRFYARVQELFPEGYDEREGQIEFIHEAFWALRRCETFFGSAPCGIGKSLASILTVLPLLGKGEKLVICFRTRSQLKIYLKEFKSLKRKFSAVSFYCKRDMCPNKDVSGHSYFDFLDACARLRDNCKTLEKPYCEYYRKIIDSPEEAEILARICAREIASPEEAVELMSRKGFCAYESLKRILDEVDVFLGTYHYAFNPRIREPILRKLGVGLSQVYLIVDEAHNLPGFAREMLSDKLSHTTVKRAIGEVREFDGENQAFIRRCLRVLDEDVFQRLSSVLEPDGLTRLSPHRVNVTFEERIGEPGHVVAKVIHDYGEFVRKLRQKLGKKRIFSYNHRVGEFLKNFFEKTDEKYVHLAHLDQDRVVLEVRCLDGREITDPVLRGVRGCILMSGSLSPLHVYRDLCLYSADNTCLREFESPFPAENRLILVAKDVSSKLEERSEDMFRRWKDYIEAVLCANAGNVAVFFTSYELMSRLVPMVETDRRPIVEQQKTRWRDVIERLKESDENVLYGVMGGKFAEGVDYPGRLLTCVVAVGLPYATWNPYEEALIRYYDKYFPGKGRLYAYLTPAVLRLIQACGRPIRSANDRGCAVILDRRVALPYVRHQLPSYFRREMKPVENPEECKSEIERFWERHKKYACERVEN